jgi:hypothetical protein
MIIYLAILLYFTVLLPRVLRGESEFLGWKKLNLELSNGASVEVETSGLATYHKFTINAFNQVFKLSADNLARLEGYHCLPWEQVAQGSHPPHPAQILYGHR